MQKHDTQEKNVKVENRESERRNASLAKAHPEDPQSRFRSGVPSESNRRHKDRRYKPPLYVHKEGEDKRLEQRRNASLRKISNDPAARFSSGFPSDTERRFADRRVADRRRPMSGVERRATLFSSGLRPDFDRRKKALSKLDVKNQNRIVKTGTTLFIASNDSENDKEKI